MYRRKVIGKAGEILAAIYLQEKGFSIVEKNYLTKAGEIDIIASKDGVIHYIEVKTRGSGKYGTPEEAVDDKKLEKIEKAALLYRARNHPPQEYESVDVMAITIDFLEGVM